MYYGEIKTCDIANGPGVRTTLFVSGCRHHCEGCFQPETWNFEYGKPFTEETTDEILKSLKPDYVRGLTLLGGEPFEPENQKALTELLRDVKKYFPKKDIWCFSGYLFEELTGKQKCELRYNNESLPDDHPRCEVTDEMLSLIDILVDGEFEQDKHELMLQFRGSSNQRIIRVAESLAAGEVILWSDERSLENLMKNK
ncbi:MAG: anaerobic ribonucleoside-triphosphate reductase activating protein [Lachnospiraceae bacterium]|nr:anaerobic ribonucleoside-triphosphate reductase activating protein [Lachnospiraceae bacterium]